MAKKKKTRKKHIPQRTCVGCRKVLAKRTLIRVVRTPDGIFVDPTGKLPGRGAYLHNQRSCWEAGLKDRLAGALKATLSQADRERLQHFAADVPEGEPSP